MRTIDRFPGAGKFLPSCLTMPALRASAACCRGCDLWQRATQTVFGEGAVSARIMFIGEQPGDKEDLAGHPFVGPAGRILNEALMAAGIAKTDAYITNAVKHFGWIPAKHGHRRINKKPLYSEVKACRPWLEAEIQAVHPHIIVCLGATAAQALLGPDFSVLRRRGQFIPSSLAERVMATVHPSSILRAQGHNSRQEQMDVFVRDLKIAARELRSTRRAAA